MPRQLAGLLCVLLGLAGAPALACPFRATDAETPAASAGAAPGQGPGGPGAGARRPANGPPPP
ncbi:hypothetical protein ACVXOT_06590, partial [Pseudomonas aeruginosa]